MLATFVLCASLGTLSIQEHSVTEGTDALLSLVTSERLRGAAEIARVRRIGISAAMMGLGVASVTYGLAAEPPDRTERKFLLLGGAGLILGSSAGLIFESHLEVLSEAMSRSTSVVESEAVLEELARSAAASRQSRLIAGPLLLATGVLANVYGASLLLKRQPFDRGDAAIMALGSVLAAVGIGQMLIPSDLELLHAAVTRAQISAGPAGISLSGTF